MKSVSDLCYDFVYLSDKLMQPQNKHLIKDFLEKISDLIKSYTGTNPTETALIQKIQPRLIIPLLVYLKEADKSDLKCDILQNLMSILNITTLTSISNFFDVYTCIFVQIYRPDGSDSELSEEIKSAVLKCASGLIKSLKKDLYNELYVSKSAEKLSIGILLGIQIAKNERSHGLRQDALDFLLSITQHNFVKQSDEEIWKKLGDLFMLYLPGLIGPLQEIILRDETQPHMITVKALMLWGHVLTLVLNDEKVEETRTDEEILKFWMSLSKDNETTTLDTTKALQQKQRNKDWLKAAAMTLKPLILKIPDARKHSNPKVRLELAKVMNNLLTYCIVNLKIVLTPMIEVLVSSMEDEDEEVRNAAKSAILDFEKRCDEKQGKIFINVIEENLQSLINKLPGLIHSGDEKLLLASLNVFSGYLKILGKSDKFVSFVCLSSNLKRLITVIRMCSEMETYPEISQKEFSVLGDVSETSNWKRPWKRFKYFTDQSIINKLEEICDILAKNSNPEIILDYLIETFQNDYETRKETLFIMNEILLGSNNLQDNVIKNVLELYLDRENLYLALEVDEETCFSLKEAHNNILQVALIMEGLGKLATGVGSNFEKYLLKSLYFVVERMGSGYWIIRNVAKEAGERISKACDLNGDVAVLIQKNVDYLTYHLTTKLRRMESNPGVLDMITVLMKNSPMEALPNLEEIINNVLKSSCAKFDSPYTISHLRLFQTFVLCVHNWLENIPKETEKDESKIVEPNEIDSLIDYIENKNKKIEKEESEEIFEENEKEVEDKNDDIEESENKKPVPRHISMVLSIARHCLNYLPYNDVDKKLIVLEILNESVLILSDYENELLPLVHEIWSPLVTRFDRLSDPLIINRSFTLLCTLSNVSKDFIRNRTLKEVLPTLRKFLIKTADKSRLKDSGSGYYFTQEFKLQRELLDRLGKLAVDLKLFEKQADCLVDCSLPYLSSMQPQLLQENCRKLFLCLKEYDPYLIWLRLHVLNTNTEYSKNVELILHGS